MKENIKKILKSFLLITGLLPILRWWLNRSVRHLKSKLVELRAENSYYRRELSKVPSFEYKSYTAGNTNWSEKWKISQGRRVLFYAYRDYSGSFYKWADAVNRYTDYAVRLAVFNSHPYQYDYDLILPSNETGQSGLSDLAAEADLIHIKDEGGFFNDSNGLPNNFFSKLNSPIIYTAYGGILRKYSDNKSFRDYVASYQARVAMTPDLNYDWFDGYFIPHSIDTELYKYKWNDGNVLAHSPSTKERKGTSVMEKAIKKTDLEFDLIHGVSHSECMLRKQQANFFFDQAGTESKKKLGIDTVIGWYGNSALEAAVFGIPTIAHLSDNSFEGALRAGKDIKQKCKIINIGRTEKEMTEALNNLLEMSAQEKQELSKATRKWIENFHSYNVCADELSRMYSQLL